MYNASTGAVLRIFFLFHEAAAVRIITASDSLQAMNRYPRPVLLGKNLAH